MSVLKTGRWLTGAPLRTRQPSAGSAGKSFYGRLNIREGNPSLIPLLPSVSSSSILPYSLSWILELMPALSHGTMAEEFPELLSTCLIRDLQCRPNIRGSSHDRPSASRQSRHLETSPTILPCKVSYLCKFYV